MNPVLALIITNIIWGIASPVFKYALGNIPVFTLAFIRFFFAALIFLPFALLKWKKIDLETLVKICLVGLFGITVNVSFFFFGLKLTDSINAPVIASTGPIFIYIFSIIFLRERPRIKVFKGLVISLIGVLLIIFSPVILDGQRLDLSKVEGNLFFLVATLGAVVSTIIASKALRKVDSFQATFISFFFSAMTFLPYIFQELSYWSFSQMDSRSWLGIIFGIFFSSGLAYYFYYYGIARISAQEVGIFSYIDPVAAIIIAYPLLNEQPGILFFLGSILVFFGIYLSEGRINYHPFNRLKRKIEEPISKVIRKLESLA